MAKQKKQDGYYRNEHCRIDADTIHTLPLSSSRQRTKNYLSSRRFGDLAMTMKAPESLNAYDLITLGQLLQHYQESPDKWEDAGEMKIDDTGAVRHLIRTNLDLAKMAKQRGLSSHKHNRKTIFESIYRWFQAELLYKYDGESVIRTRYIFEFTEKIDEEGRFRDVKIIANQNFFDLCLHEGLVFNWRRLASYGEKFYSVQLDAYLQANKIKINGGYAYRNVLREETLFKALGLNNTNMKEWDKREKLKSAFNTIEKAGLPRYLYDRENRRWVRSSHKMGLENK